MEKYIKTSITFMVIHHNSNTKASKYILQDFDSFLTLKFKLILQNTTHCCALFYKPNKISLVRLLFYDHLKMSTQAKLCVPKKLKKVIHTKLCQIRTYKKICLVQTTPQNSHQTVTSVLFFDDNTNRYLMQKLWSYAYHT